MVYFETDNERGYIRGIKGYITLDEAVEDIYRYLKLTPDVSLEQSKKKTDSTPEPEETTELFERLSETQQKKFYF